MHDEDLSRGAPSVPCVESVAAEQSPGEVTAAEPYFIEVDHGGCERCAGGKTWTVVGPDGIAIGQSWEDEDHASDVADLMNQAYWAGKGEP